MMCVAVPYHAISCAAIVLQMKHRPSHMRSSHEGRDTSGWQPEDIEQLEEISTQGIPSFVVLWISFRPLKC